MDGRTVEQMMLDPSVPLPFKMHLKLVSMPGAGAWLTAPPVQDGREISTQLFQVAVQRRLRCKVSTSESWCPACGDPLDQFCDHALSCSCKGNRTVRHNAIRNVVFDESMRAGMNAVKEKPGLLPGRPGEDGINSSSNGRRPANIWIPGISGQPPQAWDFACTSGLRIGGLVTGLDGLDSLFATYEEYKRTYKQTDAQCHSVGLSFVPLILEAHGGGFSEALRGKLDSIAEKIAGGCSSAKSQISLNIAQRVSCTLQRENARAVLMRQLPYAPGGSDNPWADVQWHSATMDADV